jgi:hypothetical protein
MAKALCFSRNRCTTVEQLDDQRMRSCCHLHDTLTDAVVEIMVRLPDLEITGVRGEFQRTDREACLQPEESLRKVIGVRIGPGLRKIINGLIRETTDCEHLALMLEECCNGVILSFTKDVLGKSPKERENFREYYAKMVKENIRLYNRCAAFAPGSSLVEGIEPPEEA